MGEERIPEGIPDMSALRKAAAEATSALDLMRPQIEQYEAVRFNLLRALPALPKFDLATHLRPLFAASAQINAFASSFRLADQMREVFANQMRSIDNAMGQIQRTLANVDWVKTLRIAEEFASYLQRLRPAEWLLASRLEARGWWLVPGMDQELTDLLGEATDDGRRGRIGTLIVRYYTVDHPRHLGSLVRSWKLPEFREHGRAEVFRQALRALRRGDCSVATLALTSR